MHDLINLIQVSTPLIIGYLTWKLNSKKTDHDYLKEENDRLNEEIKRKDSEIANLNKEIEDLKNEK